MPTIIGISTFMSRKNSILGLSEPKKVEFLDNFYTYEHFNFHAQLFEHGKKFITLGHDLIILVPDHCLSFFTLF